MAQAQDEFGVGVEARHFLVDTGLGQIFEDVIVAGLLYERPQVPVVPCVHQLSAPYFFPSQPFVAKDGEGVAERGCTRL